MTTSISSCTSPSAASMDRLDAAHALLGCGSTTPSKAETSKSENFISPKHKSNETQSKLSLPNFRWGMGGGLDALAILASSAAVVDNNSEDSSAMDQDESSFPTRRVRSASCPEGMERWDAFGRNSRHHLHFSTPTILEDSEKEAETSEINSNSSSSSSFGSSYENRGRAISIDEADNSVALSICNFSQRYEEETLDPCELLRRARVRVLEDIAECAEEKGTIQLPHLLKKYKEVYNQNGRIGIYSPAERAAIIAKFNSKRTRRVWNKKIRYNCRKNLADRRMRVKGRFVKRSSEEAAAALASVASGPGSGAAKDEKKKKVDKKKKKSSSAIAETPSSVSPSPSPSPPPSRLETVKEDEVTAMHTGDPQIDSNDMKIDTEDVEAGFSKTSEDQPFRRTRRYTIT